VSRRIMVFDDAPEILELYQMLLTDEGYDVYTCAYGEGDDLSKVGDFQPDLLILDYIAGRERPGPHLLQRVKDQRTTALIPVIVCTTSLKFDEEIEQYLVVNEVKLIGKPFELEELLSTIDDALRAG
jgi:DNA-binding response OmpR family regulator